jgi:UDP-glucose 4-epimerase
MSVTVLRPALVYGAGVRGNLAALAAGVRRGLPLPPAQGGRSMISRADLVELVIDLASDPPPSVSTWIAVDGEAYSTRRICDAMRAALGRPPGCEWLPPAAWYAACALADRLRPAEEPYRQLLFGTELYSAEALRRLRGWSPRRRLEDEIGAIMGLQAA